MYTMGTPSSQETIKDAVNRRIEGIGWGLFLILTGGAFLIPGWEVPWATWLTGVGIIMLGLSVVRYRNGIRMRWLTVLLGGLALAAGLGNFAGVELELPLLAFFLIVMGARIILRPFLEREL